MFDNDNIIKKYNKIIKIIIAIIIIVVVIKWSTN